MCVGSVYILVVEPFLRGTIGWGVTTAVVYQTNPLV